MFISTGKETKQTKPYWVEYFNVMYFYEVPLEFSLYHKHSEMDQCKTSHPLLLLEIRVKEKASGGWLLGALCGGEIGICVKSNCGFYL